MAPARKFDHDEARRRHASGEPTSALAAEFGVTTKAVWRVVSPKAAETYGRANAAYVERHRVPCETCGKQCLSPTFAPKAAHSPDGRALCLICRAVSRRERLRFDDDGALISVRCSTLDCANGERWQSPDNFPKGERMKDVRDGGIHSTCRSCQTRMRTAYRKRHPETRARDNAARMRRYYASKA